MEKLYIMVKLYSRLLASTLLLFFAISVFGQEITVSGKVTDSSGEPLPGVNVLVKGTSAGTITDIEGAYRLSAPEGSTLVFSFVGFRSQEISITSSLTTVDVSLEDDIANLEEVVITGLASSVKRSNLANSVASISADELSEISTQQTLDGALYGKFKGANIIANSGAPGGGIAIKLRGITSISGSNEPLIILDGVYIDNSAISGGLNAVSAASGGGNQSTQDNASNRIADIDPEDIQSVEILKGASAAAIYGSRASGGVIIITTKKGVAGRTQVTLKQSIGTTWQLREARN